MQAHGGKVLKFDCLWEDTRASLPDVDTVADFVATGSMKTPFRKAPIGVSKAHALRAAASPASSGDIGTISPTTAAAAAASAEATMGTGDVHRVVLLFFLEDDTVEVRRLHAHNDGYAGGPVLVRRGALPRDWRETR